MLGLQRSASGSEETSVSHQGSPVLVVDVSETNVKMASEVGLQLYALLTALLFTSGFLSCVSAAAMDDQKRVYVRLADSKSNFSRPCGESLETACGSLSLAVEDEASNVWISLQPSLQDAPRLHEEIDSVDGLVIDGSEMEQFDLNAVVGPGKSHWLTIRNCSNVRLQNLKIRLKDYKGQDETAILVQNCYNVTLEYSMFDGITLGGHAFQAENSWPVTLMNNTFAGTDRYHPAPNITHKYRLAAVKITIDCELWTCGIDVTNNSNHIDSACCADAQESQLTEQEDNDYYRVTIENCTFHHLGIEPIYEIYFRLKRYQRATALHVELSSSKFIHFQLLLKNCKFSQNSSPYDTTIKLYFGSKTTKNKVVFEDCVFRDAWAYRGGAINFYVDDGSTSSLIIRRCQFLRNSAFLEGGALAINIPKSNNVSKVLIEDSHFYKNVGGSLFPTLVGGAISSQTLSYSVDIQLRLTGITRLQPLNVTRSVFIGNSARFGSAFFVNGMFLSLRDV